MNNSTNINNNNQNTSMSYDPDALLIAKNQAKYAFDVATIIIESSNKVVESIPDDFEYFSLIEVLTSEVKEKCSRIQNILPSIEKMEYLLNDPLTKLEKEIYDAVINGNFETDILPRIKTGEISAAQLVNVGNAYSKYLMENPLVAKNLTSIDHPAIVLWSDAKETNDEKVRFKEELNYALCMDLVNNNVMYTGEGVARAATNLIGLLGIFGYKLEYNYGSRFESNDAGYYFGNNISQLNMLDCSNFYDWSCRCAGIKSTAFKAKYKSTLSGYDSVNGTSTYLDSYMGPKIPKSQNRAEFGSEYFTQGKAGSILTNDEHLLIVIGNDSERGGYYVAQETMNFSRNGTETTGAIINFYTYEQLAQWENDDGHNKPMLLTNMDAYYANVVKPVTENEIVNNVDCYVHPEEYLEQLCLSEIDYNNLQEQYIIRNKNLNITYEQL